MKAINQNALKPCCFVLTFYTVAQISIFVQSIFARQLLKEENFADDFHQADGICPPPFFMTKHGGEMPGTHVPGCVRCIGGRRTSASFLRQNEHSLKIWKRLGFSGHTSVILGVGNCLLMYIYIYYHLELESLACCSKSLLVFSEMSIFYLLQDDDVYIYIFEQIFVYFFFLMFFLILYTSACTWCIF